MLIYFGVAVVVIIAVIFFDTHRFCWKCKRIEKIEEVNQIKGFRLTRYNYKAVCKKCGKTLYDKWDYKYDYK